MDSATVDAKKELTLQLIDIVSPHVYDGIKSIFDTCKSEKNVLKTFQEKLCSIPIWNQDIIDKEFDRILQKKDSEHLDKLLDMLFVSHVKVLSVLKINDNSKIDIKVPSPKTFIHKCYVECARSFYKDPFLIDDREINFGYNEIQMNFKRSILVINNCIEKTVRDLIPLKDILEAYSKNLEDIQNEEIDTSAVEKEIDEEIDEIQPPERYLLPDSDNDSDNAKGNVLNKAFMEEPTTTQDSNDTNDNQDTYDNQNTNDTYDNDIYTNNTYTNERDVMPDLTVTSGTQPSDTRPILEYKNSEPESDFARENGIKQIPLTTAGPSDANHDDDPFFPA